MEVAHRLAAEFKAAGIGYKVDDRDQYSPGWKFNDWEKRGVPLRIELGPKDVDKNQVVIAVAIRARNLLFHRTVLPRPFCSCWIRFRNPCLTAHGVSRSQQPSGGRLREIQRDARRRRVSLVALVRFRRMRGKIKTETKATIGVCL
jgi:hypothetical protein